MAGSALAATALSPGIRMIGVEPEAGDDTRRSLAAGERVRIPVPHTIADGQALSEPGELTFAVNRRLLDSVVLVSDDEIRAAMRLAFERLKIVTEPSGASALAALLAGAVEPLPRRVGVVISGGNIGLDRFLELMGERRAGTPRRRPGAPATPVRPRGARRPRPPHGSGRDCRTPPVEFRRGRQDQR
ncbi:hypothetical protein SRIMM317S_06246 [Streptomyces rimosus subsp. rimosus]